MTDRLPIRIGLIVCNTLMSEGNAQSIVTGIYDHGFTIITITPSFSMAQRYIDYGSPFSNNTRVMTEYPPSLALLLVASIRPTRIDEYRHSRWSRVAVSPETFLPASFRTPLHNRGSL